MLSCAHLLVRIIHPRRRTLLLLLPLFLASLPFLLLDLESASPMILILSVDIFGLANLIICLSFDIVSQFLFVDHPTIVLTIVAVALLLLDVLACGQATVETTLDALHLVFLQFIPDWVRREVLSVSSCMAPPFI